jgi:5-methylcytosine-specific restriction enzyme A
MTSEDQWSTDELEASVEAYAELYRADQEGRKVNKAQMYRDLEERFGRRNKAFERRMMNISHVVKSLGGEPVKGLLPASNIGANTQPIIETLVRASGFLGESNIIHARTLLPVAPEVAELEAEELRREWSESGKKVLPPLGFTSAESYKSETTQRKRCAEVRAWVLLKANGVCECCEANAPFSKDDDVPYLEVHHVVHLANDGPDTTSNAVAVCPNCHRALHLADNRDSLIDSLYTKIGRLEKCNSA